MSHSQMAYHHIDNNIRVNIDSNKPINYSSKFITQLSEAMQVHNGLTQNMNSMKIIIPLHFIS